MHKGKLKSGSNGKKVINPKQAIAIGLSQARKEGDKVPKKKESKFSQPAPIKGRRNLNLLEMHGC